MNYCAIILNIDTDKGDVVEGLEIMGILSSIWEELKAFFESTATGNFIQLSILTTLIVGYIIITKPWQRRFVNLFHFRYERLFNEVDFLIDEIDSIRKHAKSVYEQYKSQNEEILYPPASSLYQRKEEIEYLELPGAQPLPELRNIGSRSEHFENLINLKSEWMSESQSHEIILHYSQLVQFYGTLKSDHRILNDYILRVDYGEIKGFVDFKDNTRRHRDVRAKREHINDRIIRQFYIKCEGADSDFHRNWILLSNWDGKPTKGWKSIANLKLKYDGDVHPESIREKPRITTVFPAEDEK